MGSSLFCLLFFFPSCYMLQLISTWVVWKNLFSSSWYSDLQDQNLFMNWRPFLNLSSRLIPSCGTVWDGVEGFFSLQCWKAIIRKELFLEIGWIGIGYLKLTIKDVRTRALTCSLSIFKENNKADYCLALQLHLVMLKHQ